MAKKKSWLRRTMEKLVGAYKSAPRAYNSRVSNKANERKRDSREAQVKAKRGEKKENREKGSRASTQERPKYNCATYNNWNYQAKQEGQTGRGETEQKSPGEKPKQGKFQQLIKNANRNIAERGMKGSTRSGAYRERLEKQRKELKKRQEERKRAQAEAEARRAKRAENVAKRSMLAAYDKKLNSGVPYNPTYRKKLQTERNAIDKDFPSLLKEQKAKDAKKELDKKLTQMGAKGLVKQQESSKKSMEKIKKEARKHPASKQMTTEESLRVQWAARNPTYRAKKGGDKIITKDLQKKIQHNVQTDLDRGSVGTGFMSGFMPVADLKKSMEKKYGIKLDDSKAKGHLGYNIAEMAGYLAKSTLFGGAAEGSINKALTNVILKKTKKEALGKAGKFAVNRSAEALAAAPVNLEDAAKNSKNAKEFGKNVATNMALDAGAGTLFQGIGRLAKKSGSNHAAAALVKVGNGQALSKSEQNALKKTIAEAQAKKLTGHEDTMTATHKAVIKAAENGDLEKALKRKPYSKISEINPVAKAKDVREGRKADKAFSQQVDKMLKGELRSRDELVMGRTPRKLQN